jgi:hypothetical protein
LARERRKVSDASHSTGAETETQEDSEENMWRNMNLSLELTSREETVPPPMKEFSFIQCAETLNIPDEICGQKVKTAETDEFHERKDDRHSGWTKFLNDRYLHVEKTSNGDAKSSESEASEESSSHHHATATELDDVQLVALRDACNLVLEPQAGSIESHKPPEKSLTTRGYINQKRLNQILTDPTASSKDSLPPSRSFFSKLSSSSKLSKPTRPIKKTGTGSSVGPSERNAHVESEEMDSLLMAVSSNNQWRMKEEKEKEVMMVTKQLKDEEIEVQLGLEQDQAAVDEDNEEEEEKEEKEEEEEEEEEKEEEEEEEEEEKVMTVKQLIEQLNKSLSLTPPCPPASGRRSLVPPPTGAAGRRSISAQEQTLTLTLKDDQEEEEGV